VSEPARALYAYVARRFVRIIARNATTGRYDCSKIDCPRMLLDYSAAGSHADLVAQPTAKLFKMSAFGWDDRNAVGFFRSAWSTEASGVDGKEAWLGFKAANGVPNHNDLDGGTFVFEVGGQRWANDLGADDYQLPDYFTQTLDHRYSFYRKSTAGHNTLTFNNNNVNWSACTSACDQDNEMTGITEITLFEHSNGGKGSADGTATVPKSSSPAYAIVDLTAAYAKQGATSVQRGFAFTADYEQLIIVDEFEFNASAPIHNVTWAMHTLADIKTLGASAVLSLGGMHLHTKVTVPDTAKTATEASPNFSSAEVRLEKPQMPSDGVRKLMLHMPLASGSKAIAAAIVVGLSINPDAEIPRTNRLAKWSTSGPFSAETL
jgi:hypothetical protein